MNAGGHGSDIAHSLQTCRVVDLGPTGRASARTLTRDGPPLRLPDLGDPRHRRGRGGQASAWPRATVTPGGPTIRDIVRWRREHQPGGQNAGSVFTNPPGEPPANSAGWLIDTAGCKGRRWGSAMVSPKHANFIQADDNGSADDVRALLEVVRAEVARVHGVDLTTGGAPGRLPARTLNFRWRVMTEEGPAGPRGGTDSARAARRERPGRRAAGGGADPGRPAAG